MKRKLSILALMLFVVAVGGYIVSAFLLSFWGALTSSLGTTNEVEDIHFTLMLYGSLALGVGTMGILGWLRYVWRRSLPRVVYLMAFLAGPIAYFVSMVYIAPVALQLVRVQNPAQHVEGGIYLATIRNAGVSLHDYFTFLQVQQAIIWAPTVLVWLVIGCGVFWRMRLRHV